MKPWIILIFCVLLLDTACRAQETLSLKEEKDRINYSVGFQIGGDFKRQGVELDTEKLVKGIEHALSGAQPLMTRKEMRATLVDLKKKIVAAQSEQKRMAAEKNLAEGQAFLAENAKKEGVTTLPSGLQYRVMAAGEGEVPKPNDTVTVHYRGTLIDGTEFDSSYLRNQPASFRADRVIAGWRQALQLMQPGARYELFIPPELAYGERGGGSKIGPNSTLIFEVELLLVLEAGEKETSP